MSSPDRCGAAAGRASIETPAAGSAVPLWKMHSYRILLFGLLVAGLCLTFLGVLVDLARCALSGSLYSHILLIPIVSLYLVHSARRQIPTPFRSAPKAGIVLFVVGTAAIVLCAAVGAAGPLPQNDYLALMVFSFVTYLLGIVCFVFGTAVFASLAFPSLFLYFMAPMPTLVLDMSEEMLQHASALGLGGILGLIRIPVLREGTTFFLPGLTLEVARECSGIRSTLVLLITALLAGYMCLRTPWRRAVLVATFFPIAILRNASRILTIALGTIYVDPTIIEGPVHHKGGPPFFALSLVPLFAVMLLLRRTERRGDVGEGAGDVAAGQHDT